MHLMNSMTTSAHRGQLTHPFFPATTAINICITLNQITIYWLLLQDIKPLNAKKLDDSFCSRHHDYKRGPISFTALPSFTKALDNIDVLERDVQNESPESLLQSLTHRQIPFLWLYQIILQPFKPCSPFPTQATNRPIQLSPSSENIVATQNPFAGSAQQQVLQNHYAKAQTPSSWSSLCKYITSEITVFSKFQK